jgi:hypothetical protein
MEPVSKFSSADGRTVVTVHKRTDGLYEFRAAVLTAAPEGDRWDNRSSGLFQTLGDAEAAAHAAAHA